MHDCGGWEHSGLTAREEVEAILRGEWAELGLVGPMVGLGWIPGFLQRVPSECGGLALDADPFDLLCHVAYHEDRSAADRAAGVSVEFVYAGAHKIDGNPHGPLTDQARAAVQAPPLSWLQAAL